MERIFAKSTLRLYWGKHPEVENCINIKGNAYRLIAKFNFEKEWIFIRFIGNHYECDKINANDI